MWFGLTGKNVPAAPHNRTRPRRRPRPRMSALLAQRVRGTAGSTFGHSGARDDSQPFPIEDEDDDEDEYDLIPRTHTDTRSAPNPHIFRYNLF